MKELEKLRDRQLDIEEVEVKIILILSKVTFLFFCYIYYKIRL